MAEGSLIDITELNAEDRQKLMLSMPVNELRDVLEKLMRDNRKDEAGARLDALTVYALLRMGRESA